MSAFSLYVHIPYCDSKCPYCDFNSYAARVWPERGYAAALIAELDSYAKQEPWQGRPLATIFFGGGTPSLFDPETIDSVLKEVQALWPVLDHGSLEVTLEANPGTVDRVKLEGFAAAGVNRLSIGVQSFEPRHLRRLGRIHGREQAIAAVEMAHAAGVPEVSLDLIFAVPDQTLAEWDADLDTALDLGIGHVSAYNLTFEQGTPFGSMRRDGLLRPAGEEVEAAMFVRARERLEAAGYRQYEISNYALPGRECRHNLNYWQGGEYLGVGAGAHSFARGGEAGRRWSNEKNPGRYMARVRSDGQARVFEETLTKAEARGEFVFLGLRCRDGFAGGDFAGRFGVDFLSAFPHAAAFERDGWLETREGRWRLSDRGLLVADTLFASFV
jgi:oxygen-independent coproporphyrinogen-3 oxidase